MVKSLTDLLIFVLLFGLLAVFSIQIFLGARGFSVAMDEQIHLPAGFVHLEAREIEFRKSNAPFVGILTALPSFLFSKPDINLKDPLVLNNDFWNFGNKFLFSNDADKLIFSGRMVVAVLATLMAFYVFRWGKDLFGAKAGLFALFWFSFIPLVVGHSQLISTDVGLAAFFFISSYYFWRSLKLTTSNVQMTFEVKRKKLKFQILAGIFMGMALGAKFSGALLVPLFLLFALFLTLTTPDIRWVSGVKIFLRKVLPVFAISFLVLWAIYFFPSEADFYFDGLKSIYAEDANPDYPIYLNGEFKKGGWWYYFLEGFLIKTPIPFLVFLAWALIWFRKFKITYLDKAFLLLPPALILLMTSWNAHNLGVRYLIPVFPFLAVYSGSVINYVSKKATLIVVLPISVWYVFSSFSIHPNQLSYFNEFVGGSDNGYKYMDDSNIEWGQDLKRLKKFTDENPDVKIVYIWRQGDKALDYYGIGKENNIIDLPENWWREPKGVYTVSSHFLVRAKIMSQTYGEPLLDWLSLYEPVSKIGQSFFVYEF